MNRLLGFLLCLCAMLLCCSMALAAPQTQFIDVDESLFDTLSHTSSSNALKILEKLEDVDFSRSGHNERKDVDFDLRRGGDDQISDSWRKEMIQFMNVD